MKNKTEIVLRMFLILLGFGFIIAYFNYVYASFFLFGGVLMSFLFEYFGLIKKYAEDKFEE